MTTHTPELVMALSCLSGLLALLACVVWQAIAKATGEA